jgi:hypothetical protein
MLSYLGVAGIGSTWGWLMAVCARRACSDNSAWTVPVLFVATIMVLAEAVLLSGLGWGGIIAYLGAAGTSTCLHVVWRTQLASRYAQM